MRPSAGEATRVAVFGTGAVGGYYSGRLARAGEDVVFVARRAHLDAIRRDGLRLDSVQGSDFASDRRAPRMTPPKWARWTW